MTLLSILTLSSALGDWKDYCSLFIEVASDYQSKTFIGKFIGEMNADCVVTFFDVTYLAILIIGVAAFGVSFVMLIIAACKKKGKKEEWHKMIFSTMR